MGIRFLPIHEFTRSEPGSKQGQVAVNTGTQAVTLHCGHVSLDKPPLLLPFLFSGLFGLPGFLMDRQFLSACLDTMPYAVAPHLPFSGFLCHRCHLHLHACHLPCLQYLPYLPHACHCMLQSAVANFSFSSSPLLSLIGRLVSGTTRVSTQDSAYTLPHHTSLYLPTPASHLPHTPHTHTPTHL